MRRVFKPIPLACIVALACAGEATALPLGAQVANGTAGFARTGNVLTVTNSPNAILNWQSFSIDGGETVRFIQQSAQSAVLNRVVGQSPSSILGALQSNGKVFLINPNGIVFGQGAKIDVAGLVASSLNISDADFLAGRHNYVGRGASGAVSNKGSITTADGGMVYLIAPDVANSGVVTAPNGDILLAAGHSVMIAPAGSPDVRVQLSAPSGGAALNVGQLLARSGSVGIYGVDVTQAGGIDASVAVAGANGHIYLKAERTLLAAAGSSTVADGGEITVTSGMLTKVEQGATVQADNGRIKVWSDMDTYANGAFRARNGFIETSGAYLDTSGIAIDARGGTWLIDPSDISIENHNVIGAPLATCGAVVAGSQTCGSSAAQSVSHLDANIVNAALDSDVSVVVDTAVGTGGGGNIQLYGSLLLTKTSGTRATLTLNADNAISNNGGTPTISASGSAILDVVISANRVTVSAGGGITGLGPITTNGGNLTLTASNIQTTPSAVFNTGGGTLSMTASNASGSNGLNLGGTLNSGGGHITLTSNSSSAGMLLYGVTDAGSGNVTLNLPNGGIASDNSTSAKLVASGLELLGNNATYQLGGAPQWLGWTGRSIYAPGSVATTSAQTGNPVFNVAANLTGTSAVYLYVGTPNVPFVTGNGMNTDVSVGTVGATSGLKATTVSLTTTNGNIAQTQKITATDLTLNSMSIVQGNNIDLSLAAGNSVTNLQSAIARCSSGSCSVGASATPSLQLTNATALNIVNSVDAGNGAAVIKTLTGNLTLQSSGNVSSVLAGTAANYANSIILVAGANTAANFVNNASFASVKVQGANARYLIYSKDASSITLGNLSAPTYGGSLNGGYATYFGTGYYLAPFNGGALPAAPANPAKPNAVILKNQPTLTVTAGAASRAYGNANPALTYGTTGFVLGDTAAVVLSGSLTTGAAATSGVGAYAITQGSLTAANGYNIAYTGANLSVTQRPVGIAADAQTKFVGASDPALTYTVTSGSTVNGDVLNLTRIAGETIGAYPINLGVNPNYNVTYTGNNLSITAAPVGGGAAAAGTSPALSGDTTRAVIRTNRPDSVPPAPDLGPVPPGGKDDAAKPAC